MTRIPRRLSRAQRTRGWVMLAAVLVALVPATVTRITAPTRASAQGSWSFSTYVSNLPFDSAHGTSGIGPTGVAFDANGNLYIEDYWTGTLYMLPPGGGSAAGHNIGTSLSGTPDGLAFSRDRQHLYVAFQQSSQVAELSVTTGAVIRVLATNVTCATGLATDPLTGDLFTSDACGGTPQGIYRISGVEAGTPTVSQYAVPGNTNVDGLALGGDGTLYAEVAGNSIYSIGGTDKSSPPAVNFITYVPGNPDGVTISADGQYALVNSNSGSVYQVSLTPRSSAQAIVSPGSRGDFVAVGPDGCAYATQSSSVVKITDLNGNCSNRMFTPPIPAQLGPSGSESYGFGNPGERVPQACVQGDPVNCATGNLIESVRDLSAAGRGPQLDMTRTYNSQAAATATTPGSIGYGWSFTFGATLTVNSQAGTATVTHGDGSTVTFTNGTQGYTASPLVTSVLRQNTDGSYTYTLKHGLQMLFDATGRLTTVRDRNGYSTTVTYTGQQIAQVTDASGRVLAFSYNPQGFIAMIQDPAGRAVRYSYDANGNMTSVADVTNAVTAYAYDANHRLTSVTDPNGGVVKNVYDSAGRVATQMDALNRTLQFQYGTSQTTITDPAGLVTSESFSHNLLTVATVASGTSAARATTYGYDGSGDVVSISNGVGSQTVLTYDARGNQLSSTDPLGRTTSMSYAATTDDLLAATRADGTSESFAYDSGGNLTTITQPVRETGGNAVTSYTYSGLPGDVSKATDPTGAWVAFTYDNSGQVVSLEDALSNITGFTRNVLGWVTQEQSPGGQLTTYTYDSFGRPATVRQPNGSVLSWTRDGVGNVLKATDAQGNVWQYSYDADNELTQVLRPDGSTAKATYSTTGNIATQTDGVGNVTTYSYDPVEQLSSVTDPLQRVTGFTHDAIGELTSIVTAGGDTTTYGYDGAGELNAITHSNPQVDPNVRYAYTAAGQRASMTDGTGTSTYSYDSLGRLVSNTDGSGSTTTYGYDLAGRLTTIGYPKVPGENTSPQVRRTYDAAGRLASIQDWLGHSIVLTENGDGQVASMAYPNGVSASLSRDPQDAITDIEVASPSSSPLAGRSFLSFPYTRDASERVTSQNPAGIPNASTSQVTYEVDGRLASTGGSVLPGAPQNAVVAHAYSYDAADRLASVQAPALETGATAGSVGAPNAQFQYDAASELTSVSVPGAPTPSVTFGYNPNGDRITASTGAVYTYDQDNRLVGWTSGTTPSASAQFLYNGDGLRVGKIVSQATSATSHSYSYDLVEGLPLILQDGATRFITDARGVVLEQVNADGAAWFLHQDQLGSTRAITDASGSVVGLYTYDPYGMVTSHTGSASTAVLYAGQYQDAESDLYYMRARYYDPSTAQFMSVDPLSSLTKQRYGYAEEDPLNRVDPSGAYDYVYNWRLGPTRDLGSAEHAMAYLQQHASDIFPFPLGGCTSIVLDAVCHLQATAVPTFLWGIFGGQGFAPSGTYFGDDPVKITDVTKTGFTFTTLQGHFDGPNGTITFRTYQKNGQLYLCQVGHAPNSTWYVDLFAPEIARGVWAQQAANLAQALTPPQDNKRPPWTGPPIV